MIKITELRLGNYVYAGNKIERVLEIYPDSITTDIYTHIFDFLPVELTPDILEAAGFGVNKDNSFGYINENEGILIELGDFDEEVGRRVFYYVLPDTDDYTCIAYCKHLHQLQNLYWCLCGQELQIDITKLNKEK